MAQHTPAPWRAVNRQTYWAIIHGRAPSDGYSNRVAETCQWTPAEAGRCTPSESAANARLIAAAPELLAACSDWIAWIDGDEWREDAADYEAQMLDAMRAALAKAKSEALDSREVENG